MKMMRLVWHSFTHVPDDSISDVLADCTCSTLVILRTSICRLDSAVKKKKPTQYSGPEKMDQNRDSLFLFLPYH